MTNDKDQLEKFKSLIEEVRTCIFITKSADAKLKGRPMATADVDDNGDLWFFTNEYSGKVQEVSHDHEIFLSYSSPSKNSYVTISANATLSDDKEKMKALWNPFMKAWFPEGLNDPKILLIKAIPEEIEYWDNSSNKIVVLFNMVKAAVSGKGYTEGEHGKLNL